MPVLPIWRLPTSNSSALEHHRNRVVVKSPVDQLVQRVDICLYRPAVHIEREAGFFLRDAAALDRDGLALVINDADIDQVGQGYVLLLVELVGSALFRRDLYGTFEGENAYAASRVPRAAGYTLHALSKRGGHHCGGRKSPRDRAALQLPSKLMTAVCGDSPAPVPTNSDPIRKTTMNLTVRQLLRAQIANALEANLVVMMPRGDGMKPRRDFI